MAFRDLFHAFGGAHHVGEPDAEFLVHHHQFAARDAHAVHEHVQRLTRLAVEFDDGAGRQLQEVANRHLRPAHLQRQRDRHVEYQIEVHLRSGARRRVGTEFAELRRSGRGALLYG
jgi:hypothetical protein